MKIEFERDALDTIDPHELASVLAGLGLEIVCKPQGFIVRRRKPSVSDMQAQGRDGSDVDRTAMGAAGKKVRLDVDVGDVDPEALREMGLSYREDGEEGDDVERPGN